MKMGNENENENAWTRIRLIEMRAQKGRAQAGTEPAGYFNDTGKDRRGQNGVADIFGATSLF
jgi:hypothetical protein